MGNPWMLQGKRYRGVVYAGRCQLIDSGDEESSCSQFQCEFQRDCHPHCAVSCERARTESLCPGGGFVAGAVALLDLPEVSRDVGPSASQADTSDRGSGVPRGQAALPAGNGAAVGPPRSVCPGALRFALAPMPRPSGLVRSSKPCNGHAEPFAGHAGVPGAPAHRWTQGF